MPQTDRPRMPLRFNCAPERAEAAADRVGSKVGGSAAGALLGGAAIALGALILGGCVIPPGESGGSTRVETTSHHAGAPSGGAREMPAPPSPAPVPSVRRERMPTATIAAIFEDTLGREPSRVELRELQGLSEDWSEAQLRDDLRQSREYRELSPERVIRRAYRDLLHREPDPDGLRNYRRMMIDRGWSPGQVREAIRQSAEYRTRRYDVVIERAYEDILERAPDPAGRESYTQFLKRGGTEEQMRDRLRDSVEYRVTLPDSKVIRAYREILRRDPDQSGLETYRRKIVDQGWSEQDLKNALRRSDEYRNMKK